MLRNLNPGCVTCQNKNQPSALIPGSAINVACYLMPLLARPSRMLAENEDDAEGAGAGRGRDKAWAGARTSGGGPWPRMGKCEEVILISSRIY